MVGSIQMDRSSPASAQQLADLILAADSSHLAVAHRALRGLTIQQLRRLCAHAGADERATIACIQRTRAVRRHWCPYWLRRIHDLETSEIRCPPVRSTKHTIP